MSMRKLLEVGALALGLSFANAAVAESGPEFNAQFTFPNPLGGADTIITVPIDCDLLGANGEKTLDFIKQFDIWGHLEHEDNAEHGEAHLRAHGITPERLESVRQHCIENF